MDTTARIDDTPGAVCVEGLARNAGALDAPVAHLRENRTDAGRSMSPPFPPAYKVSQSRTHPITVGEKIARRLDKLAKDEASTIKAQWLTDTAAKLRRCVAGVGYRCGLSLCPRCARWRAIQRRRLVEERLHSGTGAIFNLRLSCASDDLIRDSRVMRDCFAALRRCAWWRAAVLGGTWDLEATPVTNGARRWNLHFHVLVEAVQGTKIPAAALTQTWPELLLEHNRCGSTYVEQWDGKWA